MRENAAMKARRYLTEGRLVIIEVREDRISAFCRGDGAVWAVGYSPRGWECDCPALSSNCSHLLALRLVTTANRRPT